MKDYKIPRQFLSRFCLRYSEVNMFAVLVSRPALHYTLAVYQPVFNSGPTPSPRVKHRKRLFG